MVIFHSYVSLYPFIPGFYRVWGRWSTWTAARTACWAVSTSNSPRVDDGLVPSTPVPRHVPSWVENRPVKKSIFKDCGDNIYIYMDGRLEPLSSYIYNHPIEYATNFALPWESRGLQGNQSEVLIHLYLIYGSFHKWGYPKIGGLFHGKSGKTIKMEDLEVPRYVMIPMMIIWWSYDDPPRWSLEWSVRRVVRRWSWSPPHWSSRWFKATKECNLAQVGRVG